MDWKEPVPERRTKTSLIWISDLTQRSAPLGKRRVGVVDLAGWMATMDMEACGDMSSAPIEEIRP